MLNKEPWRRDCLYAADFRLEGAGEFDREDGYDLGPMGSSSRKSQVSVGSSRMGVVPSTLPSLRVERMRRARWNGSSVLNVGGGWRVVVVDMTMVYFE